NAAVIPLGDFSTVYQFQDQLSRTIGRHTLKFGAEFRRIQSNGPLDFGVNGLYTFQDLSTFGFPVCSNNPALEFFLQAEPLSYVGSAPSMSDSHRDYRQSVVSAFGQDFFRVSSRLTLNAGLRYDFYSNPTEAHGRSSVVRNPATDSGPTVGKLFCANTSGSVITSGWLCVGHLWRWQDRVTGRSGYLSRSAPLYLVWCRSVSTSFFRLEFLCVSWFSQPAKCLSDTTALRSSDHLPSKVPIRVAIQPQPGTGSCGGNDSQGWVFWCARQPSPSRSRS